MNTKLHKQSIAQYGHFTIVEGISQNSLDVRLDVPSGDEKNIMLPMGNQIHISLPSETMDICLNLN
jgi:hypothetical protein